MEKSEFFHESFVFLKKNFGKKYPIFGKIRL